jgi:archaellum component FlaC
MRAVQEYVEIGRGFDPEELQSELTEIEEDINRFQTIRGQCTEISDSRERIEETLREIEEDVTKRLAAIEAELTETGNG